MANIFLFLINFLMTIGVETKVPTPSELATALPEGSFSWGWALFILIIIYAVAFVIFWLFSRAKKKNSSRGRT